MLILQTLLGFMLVSLGVQNLKNNEKENRSIGISFITRGFVFNCCIFNKIFCMNKFLN